MQLVKSSILLLLNISRYQQLKSSIIRPQKSVISQEKQTEKSFPTTNHRTLVRTTAVNTPRTSFTEQLATKTTPTQMPRSMPAIRTNMAVFSVVINKQICSSKTLL